MQIYSNIYLNCRLKISEWSQFEIIMKREKLNKSDALRMLFHLGLQTYYTSRHIDPKEIAAQDRPGRVPVSEKRVKPSCTPAGGL